MIVRAQLEGETIHFRVTRRERREAWLRAGDLSIEHLEREPGGAWRDALRRLAPLDEREPRASLVSRLHELGARTDRIAALPDGVQPPRWSLAFRSGGPGRPWPFDPELAALELGLRRAIKREGLDDDDDRRLRARGCVVLHEGATRIAALSSRDAQAAIELEREVARDRSAAIELGARLGYPACCVGEYARLGACDDATLLALRLGPPDLARPPELVFLLAPLSLVSHTPCSPSCEPTLAIARAVLAHLERQSPGFGAAWRALASALHAIDETGRAWILHGRGSGPVVVERALELCAGGALREAPEHAGSSLAHEEPTLGHRPLSLLADHR